MKCLDRAFCEVAVKVNMHFLIKICNVSFLVCPSHCFSPCSVSEKKKKMEI